MWLRGQARFRPDVRRDAARAMRSRELALHPWITNIQVLVGQGLRRARKSRARTALGCQRSRRHADERIDSPGRPGAEHGAGVSAGSRWKHLIRSAGRIPPPSARRSTADAPEERRLGIVRRGRRWRNRGIPPVEGTHASVAPPRLVRARVRYLISRNPSRVGPAIRRLRISSARRPSANEHGRRNEAPPL